jgi:hypothetical protein
MSPSRINSPYEGEGEMYAKRNLAQENKSLPAKGREQDIREESVIFKERKE